MKRQNIIPIIILLIMLILFATFFYRWNKSQEEEEQQNLIDHQQEQKRIQEEEKNIINENYIESPKQEVVVVEQDSYDWVKNYSAELMNRFQIDHAHRDIFKVLRDFVVANQLEKADECDFLYLIFSQCNTLSVVKKMDLAVYIVWKSRNQQQIDSVYDTIMAIASDNQENPKVRANALEILMRSNNKIYMDRSRRIMENLQEHEKVQEMAQILQRMERIQNVMRNNAPPATSQPPRAPLTPYQQVHQLNNQPPPMTPEEQQVQQALLDQYRRLERRAFNAMNKKATVYDDTQNVHNHKINETVIESVKNIMDHSATPAPLVLVERELAAYYPDYHKHREKIQSSINRIRSDPSKFKGETTISQVFDRIVSIISNSRHKQEMWKRLGEELVEMNQLCATGHLSRIVNVIQGFDDVPNEFQIRMDPKDEIYANISNYITMNIQESGEADKLLESMIDPEDRTLFIGFVCIILKPKVAELQKEYQGIAEPEKITECINASIKNYIKNDAETETVLKSIYQ